MSTDVHVHEIISTVFRLPTLFWGNLGCLPPPTNAIKLDLPTISAKKIPALKSGSFSSEIDSDDELYDTSRDSQFTWIGSEDYERSFAGQYHQDNSMGNPKYHKIRYRARQRSNYCLG